jgi:hypothetical protein
VVVTLKEKRMAKQIRNTSAARLLNKALWMQALDELEREYIRFQVSSANASSARHEVARDQNNHRHLP